MLELGARRILKPCYLAMSKPRAFTLEELVQALNRLARDDQVKYAEECHQWHDEIQHPSHNIRLLFPIALRIAAPPHYHLITAHCAWICVCVWPVYVTVVSSVCWCGFSLLCDARVFPLSIQIQ